MTRTSSKSRGKRRQKTIEEEDEKRKKLHKLYTSLGGPAAYGSIARLQQESGLSKENVLDYLQSSNTYTKYAPARKRFKRLKVVAYRINEIWCIDLAYMDKLTEYNSGVNYLMVCVDVLSRFLRVQPMKNKYSTTARDAFMKMLSNKNAIPEKVWTDKGTEFKGEFQKFCKQSGIQTYTTESDTKAAFAERNIRSLKILISKYFEENKTFTYLPVLQKFVNTINSRVNRITKLAPKNVVKKHETYLVSLATNEPTQKPKFNVGDTVRISTKYKSSFSKGYYPTYKEEVFKIGDIKTLNPPTYQLLYYDKKEKKWKEILGKFYNFELIRFKHDK